MMFGVAALFITGTLWAAQAQACNTTYSEGDVNWTRIGGGWSVTTCKITPISSVCTTYDYNSYMDENGNERNRNCDLNQWTVF